ncbi:MAG: DUF4034 domain-containing protein [Deltaproteobacteria bacterium]|nr:DUF4034 domain-containing protein [Deltaproteobacteria bacterium]
MKLRVARVLGAVVCTITSAQLTGCDRLGDLFGSKQAAEERSRRETPVAEIAPAPLPKGLPLAGKPGVDPDGYPLQWVDRVALRNLLRAQRYAELDDDFAQLQDAFEADPRKELWPHDAAAAFESNEPALLAQLDAWVKASPRSFAPFLARGAYRTELGYARRGAQWAKDTHPENFAAMEDTFKLALGDLEHSLLMRPRLVAAITSEIEITRNDDHAAMLAAGERGAAICPTCFLFRGQMMHGLEPRWGGSFEKMAEFAGSAPVSGNARLRLLPGYIDADKALSLHIAGKLDDALAAIDRACSLGDHWLFLVQRAEILESKHDLPRARQDIERALALRPGEPQVLFPAARILHAQQEWEAAGRALREGLQIDPTNDDGRRIFAAVVSGLLRDGGRHFKAGRKDDALRVIELAIDLDPQNMLAHQNKNYILEGPGTASTPDELAELRAKAEAAPHDFRAHQALDYALAKQGKLDEVLEMWTRYLALEPRDGQAHMERAGTYIHLGKTQGGARGRERSVRAGRKRRVCAHQAVRALTPGPAATLCAGLLLAPTPAPGTSSRLLGSCVGHSRFQRPADDRSGCTRSR